MHFLTSGSLSCKNLLGELFFTIAKRRVFVPLISVCRNQPFEQGSPKRGKTCARLLLLLPLLSAVQL